jgi:hypothetical protein
MLSAVSGGSLLINYFENWVKALQQLVKPLTKGDPESSLRWTIKSIHTLSEELCKQGYQVFPNTVLRKLFDLRYNLRSNEKALAGKSHPDRNAQFEYINNKVNEFKTSNSPVISVDTKKKEILGIFKNICY